MGDVLELKMLKREPNPDVVAIARDFLARAESGRTTCVALVMNCDDDFLRAYAGKGRKYEMVGMARMLEQQVISDLLAGSVPGPEMIEPE